MTVNNTQQSIVFIGLICIAIVGIIFLSIAPNITKINKLISAIIESNSQKVLIEASKNQTEELKKKMSEYQQGFSLASVYSMLVKKDAYKDIFNSVYDLAEKNSLDCELKYSGDSAKTDPKKQGEFIMVSVIVKGEFNNSMLFLEKMENYPYLLDIIDYKISKQADGKIVSNYNLKVYANPQN